MLSLNFCTIFIAPILTIYLLIFFKKNYKLLLLGSKCALPKGKYKQKAV